jgi:hypothetical protein
MGQESLRTGQIRGCAETIREMCMRKKTDKNESHLIRIESKRDMMIHTETSPDIADAAMGLHELCIERLGLNSGTATRQLYPQQFTPQFKKLFAKYDAFADIRKRTQPNPFDFLSQARMEEAACRVHEIFWKHTRDNADWLIRIECDDTLEGEFVDAMNELGDAVEEVKPAASLGRYEDIFEFWRFGRFHLSLPLDEAGGGGKRRTGHSLRQNGLRLHDPSPTGSRSSGGSWKPKTTSRPSSRGRGRISITTAHTSGAQDIPSG